MRVNYTKLPNRVKRFLATILLRAMVFGSHHDLLLYNELKRWLVETREHILSEDCWCKPIKEIPNAEKAN